MSTPVTFISEVKQELAQVYWPTRQETAKLTVIVIGVSLLVGLFIGGLDILFVKTIELLIK